MLLNGSQGQFGIKSVGRAVGLCHCIQYSSLFDLQEPSVDLKSVCNHFNLSAAGVEQIIVIYLIEN